MDDPVYWYRVLKYCADGNLQSVLDEFGHLIYSNNKNIDDFAKRLGGSINIRTTYVKVDSADGFIQGNNTKMRSHYAVDFGNQNMDVQKGRDRIKGLLDNFNSPFRPFVLATTSVGQEGLDFHFYCRKIMHWNLPTNPIDLEQREGRINRFKGLVIRQNIVSKYRHEILNNGYADIWDQLFKIARDVEGKQQKKPELVPFWHVESNGIYIERINPLIRYSKEVKEYERLLSVLTLYRLTFGQPRQEELVETLYSELDEKQLERIRKELMINLNPFTYK